MSKKYRRAAAKGADVVSLAEVRAHLARTRQIAERLGTGTDGVAEYVRTLADVAGLHPERGRRTPSASISRLNRIRLTVLDLADLVNILSRGEDGDTERTVDLGLRMLKTDAHLASVWESRYAPIYSADWEVRPAKYGDAELAKRGAQGCAEALEQIQGGAQGGGFACVQSALLNGAMPGFAVCEKVYRRGTLLGQPAWVPDLVPVHARRFRWSDFFEIGLYDNGAAAASMRALGFEPELLTGRGAAIVKLPAGKYLIHQPLGVHDYPTATGMVHSLARWWWVKQTVTKYWLAGAEVGANPRIIGKLEQVAAGVTVDEFLDDLEKLAADGILVLRDGTSVEFKDGSAKSTGEVWDRLFTRMDFAMSKRVLGSTLNVEVGDSGGNRALGESQDAVTIRPRQEQDAAQMWSTIGRSYFADVIRFNPHIFPAGTPTPTGRSLLRDFALTPAAVTTTLEVMQRVALKALPRTSAVETLIAFGIEREQAERILGVIGRTFFAEGKRAEFVPDPAGVQPKTSEREVAPKTERADDLEPDATVKDPATALNGAQIDALKGIIVDVATGVYPRATGIALIVAAFPLSAEQAEEIMGTVGSPPDKESST